VLDRLAEGFLRHGNSIGLYPPPLADPFGT
jgi:hypothetical protein